MLITRWNEASRALPVLALKSNYLDRWPNDCKSGWHNLYRIYLRGLWPVTDSAASSVVALVRYLAAKKCFHFFADVRQENCSPSRLSRFRAVYNH